MTLADLLRQEASSTLLKDISWLPEKVIEDIRGRGKFSIICDRHIREISTYSLPMKYEYPIKQWATQQGFRVSNSYNSYGVKYIDITL